MLHQRQRFTCVEFGPEVAKGLCPYHPRLIRHGCRECRAAGGAVGPAVGQHTTPVVQSGDPCDLEPFVYAGLTLQLSLTRALRVCPAAAAKREPSESQGKRMIKCEPINSWPLSSSLISLLPSSSFSLPPSSFALSVSLSRSLSFSLSLTLFEDRLLDFLSSPWRHVQKFDPWVPPFV